MKSIYPSALTNYCIYNALRRRYFLSIGQYWVHGTTEAIKGTEVTDEQRTQRAEQVAHILGDNKLWHSHGRMIGPSTLWDTCKLRIDDYSTNVELRGMIRAYNELLTDYIVRLGHKVFIHGRDYF